MLFYILIVIVLIFSIGMAIDEIKGMKNQKYSVIAKDFAKSFFGSLLGFGLLAFCLFGILTAIFANAEGNRRDTRNVEMYHVAEKSQIENTKSEIKFTSVDDNGMLSPQKIEYESLSLNVLDQGKIIVVVVEDQYHTWLAPWNLNTFKHVILV